MKTKIRDIRTLVPPLEMCRAIPSDSFTESALVWTQGVDEMFVDFRDARPEDEEGNFPAPTLEEIEEALYEQTDFVGTKLFDGVFQISAFREDDLDTSVPVAVSCKSAARAALKLWFKQRGIRRNT